MASSKTIDATLVETLNRVVHVTEKLVLANTDLTNALCDILVKEPPFCPTATSSSSQSLLSSFSSLSLSSEQPSSFSLLGSGASLPVLLPQTELPRRWKYGPEIPTPQAIAMLVQGFPEGRLYVVTVGTAVGVFATWALASPHVTGVSGNSHKAVDSRRAAVDFWTSAYDSGGARPAIKVVESTV
ncbi:hypothetical protein C8J56DRAFT_1043425 [Mycena floridula]|nr:hypothetical protein C8J56DRAFT_1043425 [Mycena floridula]